MKRAAGICRTGLAPLFRSRTQLLPTFPHSYRSAHTAALLVDRADDPPSVHHRAPPSESPTTTISASPRPARRSPKAVPPEIEELDKLLENSSTDLPGLLSTILPISPALLSPKNLLAVLKKRSDPSSLLRLTPLVLDVAGRQSLRSASFLLAALLGEYGRHRMIAAVPHVLAHFRARARDESLNMQPKAQEMIWAYHRIIASLWRFSSDSRLAPIRQQPLPRILQAQVYGLVKELIDHLDALPSSSNPAHAPSIPLRMRLLLLGKRYTSPPLRDLLVAHIRDRGIEMTASEWHFCAVSASREGKADLVEWFLQEKELAAERTDATSRAGSAAGEGGVEDSSQLAEPPPITSNPHDNRYEAILRASTSSTLADATSSLEPFLITKPTTSDHDTGTTKEQLHPATDPLADPQTPSLSKANARTAAYAWSTLFHKLSTQLQIPTEDIQMLYNSLASDLFLKETITPLMKALVLRGNLQGAWDLWQDLAAMEEEAVPAEKGKWVDRVVLSVATEISYALHGLSAAVELVDTWARRAKGPTDPSRVVVLDAWNVNTLLHICRLEQSPSVALRLWTAAYPRWGVKLDEVSLNLLLDTARFAPPPPESVGSRLRALAHTFLRSRSSAPTMDWDDYDVSGFASGGTSVLLDPPEYTWASQHGDSLPWQRAKAIFEEVIHGTWPHLEALASPLELSRGALGTSYTWHPPLPTPSPAPLPSVDAKYTHIIPDAGSLHAYIGLLAHHNCKDQIPIAFAHAKALNIIPRWETMRTGLLSIGEIEGPRRRIKGWGENGETKLVRDEDIMRRWLCLWLDGDAGAMRGEDSRVPTEDDVAEFSRELTEKYARSISPSDS